MTSGGIKHATIDIMTNAKGLEMKAIMYKIGRNDEWQVRIIENAKLAEEVIYLLENGYTIKLAE